MDETPLRRPSIQRISSPAERPSGYTHTPVMAVSSISDRQAAPTGEQPAVVTEERLKLFARVIDYNDAGDVDDTENIVIGKLLALVNNACCTRRRCGRAQCGRKAKQSPRTGTLLCLFPQVVWRR